MADIDYRDLWWDVRSELPGVPQQLLFFHYAEAVREFFRRSQAWQYSIALPLDVAAATAWPTITAGTHIPAGTYVVEPLRLKWLDGSRLTFATRVQLDGIDSTWEQRSAAKPSYWTILSPGSWRLYPLLTDAVDDALYMRVALAPSVNLATATTSIPEELVAEHRAAWARGAKSSLMAMPGKDWTSLSLAKAHGDAFEADVAAAKSRAQADYGKPRRSVVYGGLSIGGSGAPSTNDYGN